MSISTIRVNVTDATAQLIRSKAAGLFKQTGRRLKDGTWDVPLSFDTYERLQKVQLDGETMNDTIFRVVTLAGHAPS